MGKVTVFPFHKCTICSKYGKDEINKILKSFVDNYGNDSWLSNKYYGIVENDKFSIQKSSYLFNTNMVRIKGKIIENSIGESIVKLTFLLTETVFVVSVFSFLFLILIFVFVLTGEADLWLKLSPLLLLLLGYLLIGLSFYFIVNDSKSYIIDKIKGRENNIKS